MHFLKYRKKKTFKFSKYGMHGEASNKKKITIALEIQNFLDLFRVEIIGNRKGNNSLLLSFLYV